MREAQRIILPEEIGARGKNQKALLQIKELSPMKESRLIVAEFKSIDSSGKTEYAPVGIALPLDDEYKEITVMFASKSAQFSRLVMKANSEDPKTRTIFKEQFGPDPRPLCIESGGMIGFDNIDQVVGHFNEEQSDQVRFTCRGRLHTALFENIFDRAKERALEKEKEWDKFEKAFSDVGTIEIHTIDLSQKNVKLNSNE